MDLFGACIVGVALLIDRIAGDPPNRFHPVAWMGTAIAWAKAAANATTSKHRHGWRFTYGTMVVMAGGAISIGLGLQVESACYVTTNTGHVADLTACLSIFLQALALKMCFGARSLATAARSVASALVAGDLALARQQLARHLVSRDVSRLNRAEVSAATIESVAENSSDSVVAPLFFYVIAGLPGAFLYRFLNTCDAMLGYRTEELEWFGKASARADDLLNLVPARLTAGLLLLAALPSTERFASGFHIWRRDARLTASPNAGHPMSAAAGALGVMLEKKHHYCLGDGLPLPDVKVIGHMLDLFWRCVMLAALLAIAAIVFKSYLLAEWI